MNGELYAYKENCNYLEMLTDKNLETRILESLKSELIKVGKVSMVKSIVKLIRMRPAKHFTILSDEAKMLAFMDVVLDVDNWKLHDAVDTYMGSIAVRRFSNCTYQIKTLLDTRIIPPFSSSSDNTSSYNPVFDFIEPTLALFPDTRPTNYISPNSPWPVKGQEVSEIEQKRQQYLANLANSISTPVADKFFNEIANGKKEIIQRIYEVIG